MAAKVEFIDNSMKVKAALNDACIAYLYEAAGELTSQVKDNTRVGHGSDRGQTKNAWEYKVDESKMEATVGNPLENAIWEEFGTGEYAVHGDGRKGYWVFVEDGDGRKSRSNKQYTLEEAKAAMAYLRNKGLKAYYTKGKTPNKALQSAFNTLKGPLKARAEKVLKAKMN